LKRFLLLSAAILFAMAASAPAPTLAAGHMPQAPATEPPPPSTNPLKSTAAGQERAKKIYTQDCEICHGTKGDGKTDVAASLGGPMPDWTDPKSLAAKSDKDLFDVIRNGKDKMPAEDSSRAKHDDVWNLILYIRAMSKNQAAN
jgi:mono/diheme cytochrome c family protein